MYEQPLSSFEPAKPPRFVVPKKYLIIGGVSLVVILIVVGLFWFVRRDSQVNKIVDVGVQEKMQAVQDDCDKADNPETCRVGAALGLANEVGGVEPCLAFEGEEYDSCVWLVAREQMKAELCASIVSSEQKDSCIESAVIQLAESENSIKVCDQISNTEGKLRCEERIEPTDASNCVARYGEGEQCNAVASLEQAVKRGDFAACSELSAELQDSCYDVVGVTDVDRDGLTASDEAYYGTNPLSSDSDGDGYKDGDELNAGFNPNGPGLLAEGT